MYVSYLTIDCNEVLGVEIYNLPVKKESIGSDQAV